ncbi:hypothetical protein Syncc8109_2334 [Synechococcus sp. WH 8109]|nr:hypothetical protein Syncc8109_2334 [Synechococcus sp. WH 8109]
MQMRVIAIPPTRELADLALVATNGLTAARATALREEAFDQQRVAPKNGSGCCCVEHAADKGQRLCLVHADKNRRQRLVRRNVRTVFWCFRRN